MYVALMQGHFFPGRKEPDYFVFLGVLTDDRHEIRKMYALARKTRLSEDMKAVFLTLKRCS